MAELKVVRFRAKGVSMKLKSSYGGTAALEVVLWRKTRTGRSIRYELEIEIERSSHFCVLAAFQEFTRKEKESVDEMAKAWGLPE